MPLIATADLAPGPHPQSQQIYCGLDNCVTAEVLRELVALHNEPNMIYGFERALQAPALEMMLRGFKVDEYARRKGIGELKAKQLRLYGVLDRLALAATGKAINPRSQLQLQDLFYSTMHLPEQWTSFKGERKLSMNREALEKLDLYFHAKPFVACILAIRENAKALEMLETQVDPDGRIRTSINIAGTECIAGDSLVLTRSGLYPIEKLYNAGRCQVWNGAAFVSPVRFVKYQARQGFMLRLTGGYTLKCSSNHPVMTQRGFVEAQELLATDSVRLQVGNPGLWGHAVLPKLALRCDYGNRSATARIPEALSQDLCEFIGMCLADGSLDYSPGEHYRMRLANHDPAVLTQFAKLTKTLFGLDAALSEGEIGVSSGNLAEWFMKLGFIANGGLGTATRKTIPHTFLSAKAPMLRALLRGLTLDSHLTDNDLMYGTQSPKMQDQIQQILLLLGIVSRKIVCGNSIKLSIAHVYVPRFLALIGFVQPRKLQQAALMLNTLRQWHEPYLPNTQVLFALESKEPWLGDVFDVTMPEGAPPQYFAQGMLVHNTGRWSSSKSSTGSGGNLQNIDPSLRYIFEADAGWKLCGIDLEQAESREVGWLSGTLFGEWSYYDACLEGDLHTITARLVWPRLAWTGDLRKDRGIADQGFYRHFSYRDMSKRAGHGSNYMGMPPTMARHLKIEAKIVEAFQSAYFGAYPGIPRWHRHVAQELQTTQQLTTVFGRQRHFFGRSRDDATLREAIAFGPQSATADRMNLIIWRLWKHMGTRIKLLLQVHDAVYFLFNEHDNEADVVSTALGYFDIPMRSGTHSLIVPGEAKTGWNWGAFDSVGNPNGLAKFKGADKRKRITIMDRVMT